MKPEAEPLWLGCAMPESSFLKIVCHYYPARKVQRALVFAIHVLEKVSVSQKGLGGFALIIPDAGNTELQRNQTNETPSPQNDSSEYIDKKIIAGHLLPRL
eukprot:6485172-Amphidinium_carterae.1